MDPSQQQQLPPTQPQQPPPPPQPQHPQPQPQQPPPPPQPQQPPPPPQHPQQPPPPAQLQQPQPPPQHPQPQQPPPPQPQQPPPPPQQPQHPPPQPQQPPPPPQQPQNPPPQPQQPLPPQQPQQPQLPPQQPQHPPPQPQQPPPPPQQPQHPPPQPQQPPPPPQQPQHPPPQPQQPQQPQPQQPQLPPQQRPPQPQQPPPTPPPRLPNLTLVEGPREDYLKIGVPLYEASIKCNWKAAEAILNKKRELVGYSITEHGETPLHVAASASAKGDPKCVQEFVKNLVDMMGQTELELQNKNYNTALYLAAVAGNVETVKIMVKENRRLLTMPGGANRNMMPLYAAALFGNKDVVEYIYAESKILSEEEGWSRDSRGWLIEKLVENDMFDTALKIIKKYPILDITTKSVLRVLAGKPEAFSDTKSNIVGTTIKSVLAFICFKKAPIKKSNALPLLRFIWDDIVKKPTKEIDTILRGPPDSNSNKQDNKTISGWAVKVMQLKKVILEHVEKMRVETETIMSSGLSTAVKLEDLISQGLVSMHVETEHIIKGPSKLVMQDNKEIFNKEHLALELQKLIFKHIPDMHDKILKLIKSTQNKDQLALQLKKCIVEHIEKMERETKEKMTKYKKKETYSSRVVFIAAEMGNTNFLVELIRGYPDLIWKLNDNNQSIFHIAVKHRHEGIYNLLYEIGAMKDLITPHRDPKENNMLHLVGTIAKQKRLEDVSGVALQMQLELLWFNEIKKMIPLSYRERENEDGLTPHQLFTKEHKDLVTLGEKWMKGTASQCMVVAALIATIVFAATFTVPGGYDQIDDKKKGHQDGIPVFHSKATFVAFVVADAISLILSSSSILIFLSILTSRYAEYDFLKSLPTKLEWGLATLFLSITTMMIAFGVSFFILYHKGLLWIPILICVLVVLPTLLYIWLQGGLFIDVILSTYRSRYLFKPQKRVLYYETPKV